MVFSSSLFLFLPVTLLIYFPLGKRLRNYWLLLVSIVFFAWSQPQYLWVILVSIGLNYLCGILLGRFPKQKTIILIGSVLGNLGLLFYFKYFHFAVDIVNKLLHCSLTFPEIILPIGISFFTFQGMSYVIDVYRNTVAPQKNIAKVALYIVLFPQLIAGPIVRYVDVAAEIDQRKTTLEDFSAGVQRFIIGLGKKAIIANTMAAAADAIWGNPFRLNSWDVAWLGSIAYTLQIFFDFSGYSDMAIGLGRMFGLHFNENFNLPYIAKSISEFWRRWHISLSSWFRDYVYIPLGGNRKHVYRNLAIVFLLTGLWHGAALHYLVWGLWNGAFILIERWLKNRKKPLEAQLSVSGEGCAVRRPLQTFLSRLYTLSVVHFGWILFRAEHTSDAIRYVRSMFGLLPGVTPSQTLSLYLDRWTLFVLILGILFSTSIPRKAALWIRQNLPEKLVLPLKLVALLAVFYLSVLRIVSGTYNPFIYFQF